MRLSADRHAQGQDTQPTQMNAIGHHGNEKSTNGISTARNVFIISDDGCSIEKHTTSNQNYCPQSLITKHRHVTIETTHKNVTLKPKA